MDGGGGGGGASAMEEAQRWLEIAGKLLEVRDLESCKKYAERATDTAPLLEGVDQLLAVADVLLSAHSQINDHLDWYAVLQLKPHPSGDGHDLSAVKRAYRRLALLLHPSKNSYPGSDQAFRLVCDSWAVLSDPEKKRLYDEEVRAAAGAAAATANGHAPEHQTTDRSPSPPPPPASFWTICPSCFQAHEYEEEYVGRRLSCPNCRRQFVAARLPAAPPLIPGTDFYYCSWGLFPLGYPKCPVFPQLKLPPGTLSIPALPPQQQQLSPKSTPVPAGNARKPDKPPSEPRVTRSSARSSGEVAAEASSTPPSDSNKSQKPPVETPRNPPPAVVDGPTATTRWLGQPFGSGVQTHMGMHYGTPASSADFVGRFDMNSFNINLDANSQGLGNLANLPFMP